MDLNGLKRCNDCFGYAAGDALICRVADALNDVFPGEACRIGGDEFVVICCPVTQEKFEQQVEALRAALVRHQVDAAIGSFWQSLVEDLPAFLREADDRMYREKERRSAQRGPRFRRTVLEPIPYNKSSARREISRRALLCSEERYFSCLTLRHPPAHQCSRQYPPAWHRKRRPQPFHLCSEPRRRQCSCRSRDSG